MNLDAFEFVKAMFMTGALLVVALGIISNFDKWKNALPLVLVLGSLGAIYWFGVPGWFP